MGAAAGHSRIQVGGYLSMGRNNKPEWQPPSSRLPNVEMIWYLYSCKTGLLVPWLDLGPLSRRWALRYGPREHGRNPMPWWHSAGKPTYATRHVEDQLATRSGGVGLDKLRAENMCT
jgi:hypothetical protein